MELIFLFVAGAVIVSSLAYRFSKENESARALEKYPKLKNAMLKTGKEWPEEYHFLFPNAAHPEYPKALNSVADAIANVLSFHEIRIEGQAWVVSNQAKDHTFNMIDFLADALSGPPMDDFAKSLDGRPESEKVLGLGILLAELRQQTPAQKPQDTSQETNLVSTTYFEDTLNETLAPMIEPLIINSKVDVKPILDCLGVLAQDPEKAVPIRNLLLRVFEKTLKANTPVRSQPYLIKVLIQTCHDDAGLILNLATKSDDSSVQRGFAYGLLGQSNSRYSKWLLSLFQRTEDTEIKTLALKALETCGDVAALPDLKAFKQSLNPLSKLKTEVDTTIKAIKHRQEPLRAGLSLVNTDDFVGALSEPEQNGQLSISDGTIEHS